VTILINLKKLTQTDVTYEFKIVAQYIIGSNIAHIRGEIPRLVNFDWQFNRESGTLSRFTHYHDFSSMHFN
jgi:hypothetical protein